MVYINSDSNGRGFLSVAGSHTLENFMNGVMKNITDPETQDTVWKRDQLHDLAQANTTADKKRELRTRPDLRIAALGSGSDYTVFIDHLGIASINLGYGGEEPQCGRVSLGL